MAKVVANFGGNAGTKAIGPDLRCTYLKESEMLYALKHVEVNGQDILSLMGALQNFTSLTNKLLAQQEVGTVVGGERQIVADEWYPLTDKLKLLTAVRAEVGPTTLTKVGQKIPENAVFPDDIDDIHKALASINVAYHMNHRKNRVVMYDDASGQIADGIGSYGYQPVDGENRIISVCQNPYPSEYDQGIIQAMAKRFQPSARVVLDTDRTSRRDGGDSCTFVVTW